MSFTVVNLLQGNFAYNILILIAAIACIVSDLTIVMFLEKFVERRMQI